MYLVILLTVIIGNLDFHLNMRRFQTLIHPLLFGALLVWALFIFTSFSISALGHILALPVGIYAFGKAMKEKNRWPNFLSAHALILFVIVGIISVLLNLENHATPINAIFKLKYFFIAWLLLFALSFEFKTITEKEWRLLFNIFNISTAVASFVGIVALYTGHNYLRMKSACHVDRACGMYGMYMSYAYGIALVIVLQMGALLHRHNRLVNLKALLPSLIINLVGCYLSYTRGAWIGVLVAIPFFFLHKNPKRFFSAVISLVILSTLLFFVVPKIKDTFTSSSRVYSTETRMTLYQAALIGFKQSPIIGLGHRNFEPHSAKIMEQNQMSRSFQGHAHNNFLEALASTGIFGFLALLFFHIFWFMEGLKRKDIFASITPAFVFALFVMGQFQYTLGDGENLFLIMLYYLISNIKTGEQHD